MYALPHQFPAVPLQSMGFLPVFLPSPVSSCSPSVIGVDARFTHQFPAVLLQSFGFLHVFFRGFQLLSFSHLRFHLKVLQSWGGSYQRRYDLLIYCLLSDIILYFLFVAASSLRAISHELFKRMHVKVIFRWWWLRSRQEVDYHIWRCVHTPYPHNVLLPPFQFAWMHTLLPTLLFFFACWKGV